VARPEKTPEPRSGAYSPPELERGAWYYADADAEFGPVTFQQLKQKLTSIRNLEELFVWCSGLSEWQRASEIPELSVGESKTFINDSSNTLATQTSRHNYYKYIIALLGLLLVASLLSNIYLVTLSDPSTYDLDRDIASIKAEIVSASGESDKYTGGLLKGLIDTRVEILRLTDAMLNAKRKSIFRRINLQFQIEGRGIASSKASDLAKLENDMSDARSRILAAEARAGQYTGGLVQGLALATAETERLTLAQLQMGIL
jgi:hypothetical protein